MCGYTHALTVTAITDTYAAYFRLCALKLRSELRAEYSFHLAKLGSVGFAKRCHFPEDICILFNIIFMILHFTQHLSYIC
jgi:hypothetical protein